MRSRFYGVLAAVLVTLASLLVGYGFTPAITRAVSDQDALVFRNFHKPETAGSYTYRWSVGATADTVTPPSTIALPQVGRAGWGIASLLLRAPSNQPVPLTVSGNNAPLIAMSVQERRLVSVFIPRATLSNGDVRLGLRSPAWSPPNDPRPLGVAVEQVAWNGSGWTLPPTRQLWVLPIFAAGLALLLLRVGVSTLVASLGSAITGSALALGAALRPLEVAPYTHRLLLIVTLAHVGLLVWAALLRDDQRRWYDLPHRSGAAELALLLGIGYWLLLPFQEALFLDTGSSVSPRLGTQGIGSVSLIALGLLALAPRLTPRLRWSLALGILALSGVAEASYAAAFAFRRSGPDFFILWRAAYDFSLGRPLYKIQDVLTNHFGKVFKVPPFYGMLFLPFVTADDTFILLLHRLLNVGLYLTTAGLLVRLLRPRLGWLVALGVVGTIMGLMQAPFDTIAYGQIDIVLLLLLTIALLALRNQRSWLVGLAITLGTLFKLYPVLLVGFFFVRREWRVLAWIGVWMIVLNGIAIGVMGWQNHVIYVTQVLPNISGGTSWIENQTFNGFLSRFVYSPNRTEPVRDTLINLLTYAGFTLVAGTTLLLALAPLERRSSRYALQYSSFAVVMVLAIPAAWMHYSTITILTFVALAWYAADQPLSPAQAALFAFAFGLIGYGNQWSFFDGTRNPGLPALALSSKFFGLALLWSMIVTMLWQAWALRRRNRVIVVPQGGALASTPS